MRIDTPAIFRLAVLVVLTVVVEATAVSQFTVLGARANIVPLVVVTLGLLCGAEIGAIMGFATGLFLDLALLETLGIASLLYLGIGYAAGRYGEERDIENGLVAPLAGAAATFLAGSGYALIQFMLGVNSPVSVLVVQEIFFTTAINTLVAIPVFIGVRAWLRPFLEGGDTRRSRRRRRTRAVL